jgi:hypothetical protein
MSFRYTNAAIVRTVNGRIEFLKCSSLLPVTQYNPAPCWTSDLAEAELLCGTEAQLRTIAHRYGGTAVVNYGRADEHRFEDQFETRTESHSPTPIAS